MFLTSSKVRNVIFSDISLDCGDIPATNVSTRVSSGNWYEHLADFLRYTVTKVLYRYLDCCFAWRSDCRNTRGLIIGPLIFDEVRSVRVVFQDILGYN